MKRIINYFFEEDETELIHSYKNLGIIALISFTVSILAIIA